MIAVVDAAALLGKNVKMVDVNMQMWGRLVGLRVMLQTPERPKDIFMADFENGYSANLEYVSELSEEQPVEEVFNE